MKKLTALAAALMLGIAAFAAADGAQEGKKDKAACTKDCKTSCCKGSKAEAAKSTADKTPKAPAKES